jgi:hypothetical protein
VHGALSAILVALGISNPACVMTEVAGRYCQIPRDLNWLGKCNDFGPSGSIWQASTSRMLRTDQQRSALPERGWRVLEQINAKLERPRRPQNGERGSIVTTFPRRACSYEVLKLQRAASYRKVTQHLTNLAASQAN